MRAGDRPGLFSIYFCVCLLSLIYLFPATPAAEANPGMVISRYDEFPSLNLDLDNDPHQHRHALNQQQEQEKQWVPQPTQVYPIDVQPSILTQESLDDNDSDTALPSPRSNRLVVASPPPAPATKKYKRFIDDETTGKVIHMPMHDKYVHNGLALVSTVDGSLHCIDKKDATILWTRPAATGAALSYAFPGSSEDSQVDPAVPNGGSRDDWTFVVEPSQKPRLYLNTAKKLQPIAELSQLLQSSPLILGDGTSMFTSKTTGLIELYVGTGQVASAFPADSVCADLEDEHAHAAHLGPQLTVHVGIAKYTIIIIDPVRQKRWDITYTEYIPPKSNTPLPPSKTWIGNVHQDLKTIHMWDDLRQEFKTGWMQTLNSSTTAVFDVYQSRTSQRALLARQATRPLDRLKKNQPGMPVAYINVYADQPYVIAKEDVPIKISDVYALGIEDGTNPEEKCHLSNKFPSCLVGMHPIGEALNLPGLVIEGPKQEVLGGHLDKGTEGQQTDKPRRPEIGEGEKTQGGGQASKGGSSGSGGSGTPRWSITDGTDQKPSTATTVIGWLVIFTVVMVIAFLNGWTDYITQPVDSFLEEHRVGLRIEDVARALRRGAQVLGITPAHPTLPLSANPNDTAAALLEQEELLDEKGRPSTSQSGAGGGGGGGNGDDKEKPGKGAREDGKPHGRRKKRGRGGKGAAAAAAAAAASASATSPASGASNDDGHEDSAAAEKAALKQETSEGGSKGDRKSVGIQDDQAPRKSTDSERTQELPNSAGSSTSSPSTAMVAPPLKSITVSESVLGYGSHGTVVYKGGYEGRQVAVKRMLIDFYDVAYQEVKLLQESDDHPNVVRYFRSEQCDRFLYIALELCAGSLDDLIDRGHQQPYRDLLATFSPQRILHQIISGIHHLHSLKIVHRDIKPQNILIAEPKRRPKFSTSGSSNKSPGMPSPPQLGDSGMITGVVVRSSTPTVSPATEMHPGRVMISDFGLCRKLENDQSSFHNTTMHGGHVGRGGGTIGWRAPECFAAIEGQESSDDQLERMVDGLRRGSAAEDDDESSSSQSGGRQASSGGGGGRMTRAIDIFSAGCVFYYVLTNGDHPFGDRYSRERNILLNRPDLSGLDALGTEGIEAKDLIAKMISHDPRDRPDAWTVMHHPFFWSSSKRLLFMQDCSDRFEIEDRVEGREGQVTPLLMKLEHNAKEILVKDWYKVIDRVLVENLGKYRKYDGHSVRDLLRALRNKKHHYQDLPPHVKRALGELPDGFLNYFTSRFPKLMLHLYYLVADDHVLRNESMFRHYFTD
ncbi:bifunctional endoribonuclease/protein kinase ire1 [Actinomortierella ambigua]|uniref:non-specific serine/threonine protein kinase n=1 Tax=Actinomortierella ambigua TaxID=1343610 RepID=A0A9P6U319_9FUNG|nr:bifunctional endoribonuclease/protein kinase ire1 [Actinomortierella ambigua]